MNNNENTTRQYIKDLNVGDRFYLTLAHSEYVVVSKVREAGLTTINYTISGNEDLRAFSMVHPSLTSTYVIEN